MKNKRLQKVIILLLLIIGAIPAAASPIRTARTGFNKSGNWLIVNTDIILDSLELKSNSQVFLTPVVTGAQGETAVLPTVLVTGRGMHFAYERGTMRGLKEYREKYDITKEIQRTNGRPQTIEYIGSTPLQSWMSKGKVTLQFHEDSCGCGVLTGSETGAPTDTTFNPARRMTALFVTPKVTPLPVSVHEGVARVQFEVNRTELHDSIYRCRNGQRIDNREQLRVIYDSIAYAVSDPNVEISGIEITGYASPESPYEHNRTLAGGRSKALADFIDRYVGRKYKLNPGLTSHDAVPENWKEFREMTVAATDITEQQRADLLELIDRPAYSPADFDLKEKKLKTDARFRELYRTKILPEWFPHLRATKFRISTRLKPMSDSQLAEIIGSSPEKMSLNQMMRVANLHTAGSPEFRKVIETTLRYYPDSEEANLNAAVAAIIEGDFNKAEVYLKKAGNAPEAQNARAILLTEKGDFEGAEEILKQITDLPAAAENLRLLNE